MKKFHRHFEFLIFEPCCIIGDVGLIISFPLHSFASVVKHTEHPVQYKSMQSAWFMRSFFTQIYTLPHWFDNTE